MTTLWARLKIWKAFENGAITEECAQYFDELLNNNKYVNVKHNIITLGSPQAITTQSEYAHFNGTNEMCVLGSIGSSENHFDVIKYINETTFENGKRNAYIHEGDYKTKTLDKTVYLKNITEVEYSNLGEEILKKLRDPNLTRTKFEIIYNYLKGTHYSAIDYEDADIVGFEISQAKQRLHMYEPEYFDYSDTIIKIP